MERLNNLPNHTRATSRYAGPGDGRFRSGMETRQASCPFCGHSMFIQRKIILDHVTPFGFHCDAVGFTLADAAAMTIDSAGNVYVRGKPLDTMRRVRDRRENEE